MLVTSCCEVKVVTEVEWTTLVCKVVSVVEKVTVVIMQHAPEVVVRVRVVVSVVQHIPEVVRTVDVTRLVVVTVTVCVDVFAAEAPVTPGFWEFADADIDIALITRIAQRSVSGKTWPFLEFKKSTRRYSQGGHGCHIGERDRGFGCDCVSVSSRYCRDGSPCYRGPGGLGCSYRDGLSQGLRLGVCSRDGRMICLGGRRGTLIRHSISDGAFRADRSRRIGRRCHRGRFQSSLRNSSGNGNSGSCAPGTGFSDSYSC